MTVARGALVLALFAASAAPPSVAAAEVVAEDVELEPGVTLRVYDVGSGMGEVPILVDGQTPNLDELRPVIDFGNDDFGGFEETFVSHVLGKFVIHRSGEYAFRLTSDDGSILEVDGSVLIDHDGLHGATSLEATRRLEPGFVDFRIRHFEQGGDAAIRLEWRPPGASRFVRVPNESLRTEKGVVRVTSPGEKRIVTRESLLYPGDGAPLATVHPSYDRFVCRPEGWEPKVGGLGFLSDGRLVVCEWSPRGRVVVLDGVHGDDRGAITVREIASGLAEPLGLAVVDDRIFVLQKQELTELVDHDGDGITDEYRNVCDAWDVSDNFHEFAFGLVHHDGAFWFHLAVAIDPGGRSSESQARNRGRTARVSAATGDLAFVTSGLRTPNGIGLGPDGGLFATDNQGDWVPVSKLVPVVPGAFYGSRAALPADFEEKPVTPPVVWLPQGEIGNSPGEPSFFPTGPFAGQLMVCDVTHGGIKRVFVERVNGVAQGAVFRFTQGLEAGINRIEVLPDGTIFAGGIGSGGNWGQTGKAKFGLERLRPNGRPSFEILAMSARADGFVLDWTAPIEPGGGASPDSWELERFRYEPTEAYGGPKIDRAPVAVRAVTIRDDRRRVFLEVDPGDLRGGFVYALRVSLDDVRDEAGRVPFSTEAWYTMNEVPSARETPAGSASAVTSAAVGARPVPNTLTAAEREAGFELLFDGRTTDAWRGYRRESFPDTGWEVEDGELVHVTGGGGGDIITEESFGDFDLRLEWKVEPGGNSGIMFRVTEDTSASWMTGPEMQVLDDRLHSDGSSALTSAGALYALLPAPPLTALPAGRWNRARIVMRGSRLEQWLNGVKVVECDLESDRMRELIASSKFRDYPRFARNREGHVVLQDHGDEVRYRNLRIRRL